MVSLYSSMEEINLKDETMPSLMKRWEKKLKRHKERKYNRGAAARAFKKRQKQ